MSPWDSESWVVIIHNTIVVTSRCINKATKYTSHVEKEGHPWNGILFRMDMPRGPRLGGQGLLEHVSSLQFTTLSSLQVPAPWLDRWSTCNFTFTAVTTIEKRGGLRRDETEDAWYLSAKDTLKINNNARKILTHADVEFTYRINANGNGNINQTPYLCNKLYCPLLHASYIIAPLLIIWWWRPILGLAEWAVGPTRAPRAITCMIPIWIRLATVAVLRI